MTPNYFQSLCWQLFSLISIKSRHLIAYIKCKNVFFLIYCFVMSNQYLTLDKKMGIKFNCFHLIFCWPLKMVPWTLQSFFIHLLENNLILTFFRLKIMKFHAFCFMIDLLIDLLREKINLWGFSDFAKQKLLIKLVSCRLWSPVWFLAVYLFRSTIINRLINQRR